jgi:hypothetical protein
VQLDKTRIAIRERGLLEILDLALRVIRHHVQPLLAAWLVGIVPLMLLNFWFIGWMTDVPDDYAPDKFWAWTRYFSVMSVLVLFETPLATAPLTLYLGDAMFLQRSGPWTIATSLWRLLPQLLICIGLVRATLIVLLLVFSIEHYSEFSAIEGFLFIPVIYLLVIRALRPYLGEVVLLERNPLRAAGQKTLTVGRRSAALHNPNAGDLLARGIAIDCLAVLMTVSFAFGFWFVAGTFLNDWKWGPVMVHVCVPLSMWIVAGYLGVVRFLSYLDLRIRREGWEVELRMRAEATRLARHAA